MAPSRFGWIAGSEVIGGGAEAVRVSHNAILVSRMHLATIALCKQTTDNFQTRNPPEPRWRHLSGNRILFVPHSRSGKSQGFIEFVRKIWNFVESQGNLRECIFPKGLR